ncbi:MAG: hypothetical protein FJ264_16710 [Planctomycetes bacterium]|nr:hypothetical protein [Planctomycetota bacterium]
MRILVDNTGVHSVARCLEGAGKGEIDVLGLLQFATQLIFSDTIVVGSFELGEVIEKTNRVFDELLSIGIQSNVIEHIKITEQDWAFGCLKTAQVFAEDIESLLPTDVGDLLATTPDFADKRIIPDGHIHDLISHDRPDIELAEWSAKALKQRAGGMVEYCLTTCPKLWNAIRKTYVDRGGWSAKVTAYLAVLLRMYRNDFFAKEVESCYSPAVARAKLLRQTGVIVEERLSRIILDAVKKISTRKLPAPSVGTALIRDAKGDPHAILEEACKLREKAEPLRKMLRKVLQKLKEGDDEASIAFEKQMKELSDLLEIELGLKKRPEFRDALELHFVLGIPAPSLSAKELFRLDFISVEASMGSSLD